MALETTTLPSGLRIYVDPIPTAETANIHTYIGAGSIHEQAGEEGIAHVVEHAVHLGTVDFPTNQSIREQAGANDMGSVNANTTFHRTAYHAQGPRVEPIFHRLGQLTTQPTFDPDLIAKELGSIEQEARMGIDNINGMHVYASEYGLFGAPYGRAIIGHSGKINFTAEQIRTFHDRHYRLGNMAIVASGKVTMEEVLANIERYFDVTPPAEPVTAPSVAGIIGSSTGLLKPDATSAAYTQSAALDPTLTADYINNRSVYRMALHALSARLLGVLRAEKGLAYNASLSITEYNHPSAWRLAANTSAAPQKIAEVADAIADVLQESTTDYPESAITAAVGTVRGTALSSLDNLRDRSIVHMDRLRAHAEPIDLATLGTDIRSISHDQVIEAAERLRSYFNDASKVTHTTGNEVAVANTSVLLNQSDFS